MYNTKCAVRLYVDAVKQSWNMMEYVEGEEVLDVKRPPLLTLFLVLVVLFFLSSPSF